MTDREREQPGTSADPVADALTLQRTSGTRPLVQASSPTLPAQPAMWVGSRLCAGRFHVTRQLGQGGMGTVYLAFDAERRCNVALKTLNRLDATSIYQLKNEFRSLAGVHHPNLVRLHELFCDHDVWFFTMDLVDGERFDRWVRPETHVDESRLRKVLAQLIDALEAIHLSGKLHRDVKPSNVLVRPDGQLLVLDFGLASDPNAGGVGQTLTSTEITGTPDYMSPEQAMGQVTTSATDFYAVGVMLFESLTGKRPFSGSVWEVLSAKLHASAPIPSGGDVPPDLALLCSALLSRDPRHRPTAAEIRASLATTPSSLPSLPSLPPALVEDETATLLGRSDELAALRDAYEASCQGAAIVLSLSGESGIGKSALCRVFLRELHQRGHAVLLAGRCYEQENVPFKAIDPVIDELSRYLRRLRPEHAAALLPRDAFALARLFPVLARVGAFEEAPVRNVPDPRQLQSLAFAAFGELLGRIRDRSPVVVFIDDLQWTDADSAKLLRYCLVSREVTPMLLLLSHRLEDASNPLLQAVIDAVQENRALEYRALRLEPLAPADARALAERWLGGASGDDNGSSAIAAESRGNPFFAMELARFMQRTGDDSASAPSLAALLEARVAALDPSARRLLQALALAGRPMAIDLILRASGADHAALDALRDSHLVRGSESASGKLIECYHDRVRESVQAATPQAERVSLHRGLARALEGHDEPELLSRCLEGAGEPLAAAEHAALAAQQASGALAFDQAAELYRRALRLSATSGDARRELLYRLGRALENTGRGAEAADAYLEAARLCTGDDSLDLQRMASEQLLHSGQLDRGSELLRRVCAPLGIDVPTSVGGAILSLGWSRLKLMLRTPETAQPLPASVSGHDALRLRSLRSAVKGLIGYRPLQTGSMSALYLLDTLERGDVADHVRALGFYAHGRSAQDPASQRWLATLARAVELAEQDGRPELVGFAAMMQATTNYHQEQCRLARGHFVRARKALRQCTGVEWELDSCNVYDQMAAIYSGDYADIARTAPHLSDQALRRRRVWAATMLVGFAGMPAWLTSDDTQGYRLKLEEAHALWTPGAELGWPSLLLLYGEALLSIYCGEPQRGFDRFAEQHSSSQRITFARTSLIFALGYATHRGRCAASALGDAPLAQDYRAKLLAALRESIELLRQHGLARTRGIGAMLDAALAAHLGEEARALRELRSAIVQFDHAEVRMHAAASRRRLGQLLGGAEGATLIAVGDAFMHEQGVRNLEAMTELNCPGFRLGVR